MLFVSRFICQAPPSPLSTKLIPRDKLFPQQITLDAMLTLQQRWNIRHDPKEWFSLSREALIDFCEQEMQRAESRSVYAGYITLTHPEWKITPNKPTQDQLASVQHQPDATLLYETMLANAPEAPREVLQTARDLMERPDGWLPSVTAPRDGSLFLGDFGYPFPLLTCWSDAVSKWVFTMLAMNLYEGKEDPYFENEWEDEGGLRGWRPAPKMPNPRLVPAKHNQSTQK